MAIRFQCTNQACGEVLTVADKLAGLTGSCPGCGEIVVVPRPSAQASPAGREADSSDLDAPPTGTGKMVQFGAIGLAWALLTARPWTWLLASLTVLLCTVVAQGLVGLATVFAMSMFLAARVAAAGGPPNLASPWLYPATLLPMVASAAIQGVLLGGLYRTALRQLDGHTIRVADVFSVGRSAAGMAAATALLVLGAYVGLMTMIVPGLIFMGLSAFALPMVVDGPTGSLAAFRRSWGALKGEWLRATVFHCALGFILMSGVLLLGVGLLFTFPLYVLSTAAQYRRSFAPGAVRRPFPVENPYEDAVGVPRSEQTPARVPVPAWFLMAGGMSSPVIVVAGLAMLTVSLFRSLPQQPDRPGAARDRNRPADRSVTTRRPDAGVTRPDVGIAGRTPRPEVTFNPAGIAPGPPPRFRNEVEAVAALGGGPDAKKDAYAYLLSRPINAGSRRAVVTRALIPLLNHPGAVDDAERALYRWASADDVPALLGTLRSPDDRTRWASMRILGKVRDARAAEPLASFLVNSHDREYAERALLDLGAKSEGAVNAYLTHPDPAVRSAAASILLLDGKISFSTHITLALSDLKSPDTALKLRGLGSIGTFASKVPERRSETLAAVVKALGDPTVIVRCNAARLLGEIGGEETAPVLVKALEDPDRFVRRDALESLGRRKVPEVLALVAPRLDDPDLRESAANLLREWGAGAVPEAVKALQKPDPETRKAACEILQRVGTRDALDPLRLATEDPNPDVAASARTALATVERRTGVGRKPPGKPPQ